MAEEEGAAAGEAEVVELTSFVVHVGGAVLSVEDQDNPGAVKEIDLVAKLLEEIQVGFLCGSCLREFFPLDDGSSSSSSPVTFSSRSFPIMEFLRV